MKWTPEEEAELVDLYYVMLAYQSAGLLGPKRSSGQVSKAHLVRAWIEATAPHRSKGSVEAKLMNVSAARQKLGLPMVTGYVPLPNMSRSLFNLVKDKVS